MIGTGRFERAFETFEHLAGQRLELGSPVIDGRPWPWPAGPVRARSWAPESAGSDGHSDLTSLYPPPV